MKKITKKVFATLLSAMMLLPSISAVPATAKTTPDIEANPAYEGFTFADYYALPDEELIECLSFNYTGGSWSVPEINCYFDENGLDARAELIAAYTDSSTDADYPYTIKTELLDDFCSAFGEIPSEYIANVEFYRDEEPSAFSNAYYNNETGEWESVHLYNGFKISLNTPEDYDPGSYFLDEESTKVLFIIRKLIEQSEFVYVGSADGYAIATMPLYLGDVTLDTEIDLKDVVLLHKAALDIVELDDVQKANADINGNGDADSDDAYLLLRYVLQITDSLTG